MPSVLLLLICTTEYSRVCSVQGYQLGSDSCDYTALCMMTGLTIYYTIEAFGKSTNTKEITKVMAV